MQKKIEVIRSNGESYYIERAISSSFTDKLSGEMTLSFAVKMRDLPSLSADDILRYNGQYFRISSVTRSISSGEYLIYVETEHESFVLSDEDMDFDGFVFSGYASDALDRILSGTDMRGEVENDIRVNFEKTGSVTRRSILNELVSFCRGELEYDGHTIRIARHRGTTLRYDILEAHPTADLNVTKSIREGTVNYELATDSDENLSIGDDIRLNVGGLFDIDASIRIIAITYDIFNCGGVSIQMGDYQPDITDSIVDSDEHYNKIEDSLSDYAKKSDVNASIETFINSDAGRASIVSSLSGTYVTEDALNGYVEKTSLSAEIGAYIDTQTGTAKIVNALSGTFIKEDSLGNYVTKTSLSAEIGAYIDTQTGTAKIVSAVSGTYVSNEGLDSTLSGYAQKSDIPSLDGYLLKSELNAGIETYIDTSAGKAQIVSAVSGTYVTKSSLNSTLSSYVTTTNLDSSIGTYIDSATGTAKIVSACSGTYITSSDLSGYAKTSAVTAIEQSVSGVEAAINLSSTYSKNTIGTNVYALLQLVSNANSSSIMIKADKINFTGFTTFLRASDLSSSGSTTIDGGRITTGKISANRIDVDDLKVTTVYGKGTYNTYTAMTTSLTDLYVGGGSTAPSYSNIYLAASSNVYFGNYSSFSVCVNVSDKTIYSSYSAAKCGTAAYPWSELHAGGTSSYHIVMTNTELRPSSTSTYSSFSLGTSIYQWNAVYTKKLYINGTELDTGASNPTKLYYSTSSSTYYIGTTSEYALVPSHCTSSYHWNLGSASYYWYDCYLGYGSTYIGYNKSSKLGFFGTKPVTLQTVSSSATVATLITALKAYGLIG